MTKTAVIILNWNGEAMMRRFLPALVRHTADAEIIVADNGSTDNSLPMLQKDFPSVKTLAFAENYGFAGGYNRAIEAVEAEYVVLLNSDVEVTEGWLPPLVEYMDSHGDVAACQPKLLSWHNRDSFEYAGAAGGYIDRYGYPFCRGRIFDTVEKDCGQYDTVADIHWATGACMMVRRETYLDCGGLDDLFFAHNEEIDLCWRMRLKGYAIRCVPASAVYHVGGGTLPQGNPRKTFLNFRNNLTMIYKNIDRESFSQVFCVRFLLDTVAMLQFLLKGRAKEAWAVAKARREFDRRKKIYAPIRSEIQQSATAGKPMLAPFSIVWQYHVRRKHTFAELFRKTEPYTTPR